MAVMRLQKWMAQCGVASRRRSEALIAAGRVRVNGLVVNRQGVCIDPDQDEVCVDGKALTSKEARSYFMFYKPPHMLITTFDPHNRQTVFDYLPELRGRALPVGRLDMNTRGLLLFTDDGDLAYRLTHPSYMVPKTYVAEVGGCVGKKALRQLAQGVVLDDGITAPAEVRFLKKGTRKSVIELTIHEGRNREVRRMCQAVGHPVLNLLRISFGGLTLAKLNEGDLRSLTKREINHLKSLVGL